MEDQISKGISGLVPVGTTGESPTLNHDEHHKVIEIVIEQSAGRVPVIAGTGSNSTAEAVDLTKNAKAAGADYTLQVAPYYNKPSQEGFYRHFAKVADEGGLPVIIYNIPGRTGKNIGKFNHVQTGGTFQYNRSKGSKRKHSPDDGCY